MSDVQERVAEATERAKAQSGPKRSVYVAVREDEWPRWEAAGWVKDSAPVREFCWARYAPEAR